MKLQTTALSQILKNFFFIFKIIFIFNLFNYSISAKVITTEKCRESLQNKLFSHIIKFEHIDISSICNNLVGIEDDDIYYYQNNKDDINHNLIRGIYYKNHDGKYNSFLVFRGYDNKSFVAMDLLFHDSKQEAVNRFDEKQIEQNKKYYIDDESTKYSLSKHSKQKIGPYIFNIYKKSIGGYELYISRIKYNHHLKVVFPELLDNELDITNINVDNDNAVILTIVNKDIDKYNSKESKNCYLFLDEISLQSINKNKEIKMSQCY